MHESRDHCVRRLSKHFVKRWEQRVGGIPTVDTVNGLLSESYKLRGQRRIYVQSPGGGLKADKQLAEYWHHARGLIMRVDSDASTAVTVITPH